MKDHDRGTRWIARLLVAGAALLCGSATAQGSIEIYQEYDKKIRAAEQVDALKDDLFGDSISLFNGQTEFSSVDIDLPGNNAIPVQLRRRLVVAPRNGAVVVEEFAGLGNWDIDVPYIAGTFSTTHGWDFRVQGNHSRRCSDGIFQPAVGPYFRVQDVFQGVSLHIPGQGDREMLANLTGAPVRSDGLVRRWTTRDFASVSCTPIPGAEGWQEGFVVQTGDGLRYTFDRIATRNAGTLRKPFDATGSRTIGRTRIHLLATRVEDRFGNHVAYHHDAMGYPTRIESSDGRVITMAYANGRLASATAFGKTWHYDYVAHGSGYGALSRLVQVTRPDASRWSYAYVGDTQLDYPSWDGNAGPGCLGAPEQTKDFGLVITHPAGAVGDFRFSQRRHFRSGVHSSACQPLYNATSEISFALQRPFHYDVLSIDSRTITGPGLPTGLRWTYLDGGGIYPLWGNTTAPTNATCTTCPSEKPVTVVQPDGTRVRHRFGILFGVNEGRLLGSETLDASGAEVRRVVNEYLADAEAPGQAFVDRYGTMFGGDDPSSTRIRPQVRTTISIRGDGDTGWDHFISEVAKGCNGAAPNAYCFDDFARSVRATRRSLLADGRGYARTDTTRYRDDRVRWLLGAIESVRNEDSGAVVSSAAYDAVTGMPLQIHAFGKLQQALEYDLSEGPGKGTISSISDGRDSPTFDTSIVLTNWKRGVPQLVRHPATPDQPAGVTEAAVVDDLGRITSATDQNGYTTQYAYDDMGRLVRTDFPAGDSTAWLPAISAFEQVDTAEYGIPGSHWRHTTSTGAARSVTYFDGLWRPLVVETFDANDRTNTQSIKVTRYDLGGHAAFASYPVRNVDRFDSVLPGTTTTHDALGRQVTTQQTAEAGITVRTASRYLAGLRTEVTNPRGHATTTSYMAYDSPSAEWPIRIDHPETALTRIMRDVHGAPLEVVRQDSSNTVRAARHYVYDGQHQLCKRIEPETGATVLALDEANNLAWSASGLNLPSTARCDHASVPVSNRVVRTYDARNRLKTLAFPDARGDQAWTYTADDLPSQVHTSNVPGATPTLNTYAYNRRRLLRTESLLQGTHVTSSIGYAYDANGNVSANGYPSGHSLQYHPNALGQPGSVQSSSAGTVYASGIRYHPNGALQQFTYGNGIVHAMAQNARQLPARSLDGGIIDHGYAYDGNGNVTSITDGILGQPADRAMEYDGLDRLEQAISPAFGGDHRHAFRYDALDNLTTWTLGAGGKDHAYHYDPATQQLVSITSGIAGPAVEGFGFDARGNLANKSGQLFDFDHGNRLRESRTAGTIERYQYDALGRRVIAATFPRVISRYETIFSQYAQDGRLLHQAHDRAGHAIDYIYLAGSLIAKRQEPAIGGPASITYLHTDALGSLVAATNTAGALIERMQYEPYGRVIGPAKGGPGYTGHVLDKVTGLNYMQQRYYDSNIGRFLSSDPIGADESTGANFNRYWYANNNPYKFVDPDGRLGCTGTRIVSACRSGGITALRTSVRSPSDTGTPSRGRVENPTPNVKPRPGKTISDPFVGEDLQALSDSIGGRDIDVISGYRSAQDQARERAKGNRRAAKSSQHTTGRAADIKVKGMSQAALARAAYELGRFERVNLYESPNAGVHIDYLDVGTGTQMYREWNRIPSP